jgi:hypothetical protein
MWRLRGLELAPMLRLPNVTGIAGPRRMTTLRRSQRHHVPLRHAQCVLMPEVGQPDRLPIALPRSPHQCPHIDQSTNVSST